jgi:hypothetical protein
MKDLLTIKVLLKNFSQVYMHAWRQIIVTITGEGLQNLDVIMLRVFEQEVIFIATIKYKGPWFFWSHESFIERTTPFGRLLRGCGGTILSDALIEITSFS